MGWVYLITNKINNKCYIGQTISPRVEKRWSGHRRKPQGLLKCAFEKYGLENFKFETIHEVCDAENMRETLDSLEIKEISERNTGAPNGYNLEKGGTKNKNCTNEITRKKMSESHIGKIHTDDTKHKISNSTKGVKKKKETCEKISKARIGMKFSEETRHKLSEAFKLRPKRFGSENHSSKKVLQYSKDDVLVSSYSSITEAAKSTSSRSSGISQCCLGNLKTSGGFVWKFDLKT